MTERLSPAEIGEYTDCTHGPGGGRLYGCIDCAIRWHEQRARDAAALHAYHALFIARLIRSRAKLSEEKANV